MGTGNGKFNGRQSGRSAVRLGVGTGVAAITLHYFEVPADIEEYARGIIIWAVNEGAYILKLVVRKFLPTY